MNRRDLLKYFAAGTVIAPVAGESIQARLIETPKIEIAKPQAVDPAIDITNMEHMSATINITMFDGTRHSATLPLHLTPNYGYRNPVTLSEMQVSVTAPGASSPLVDYSVAYGPRKKKELSWRL